jgi:hypothetical protein
VCVSHFIEKGDELVAAQLTFDPKARHMIYGRVSFHLESSITVSKFSPTLPIISLIHQLLIPRCTIGMKNCNNLGSSLSSSSLVRISWHECPRVMPTRGEEDRGEDSVGCLFVLLTKRETLVVGARLPLSQIFVFV